MLEKEMAILGRKKDLSEDEAALCVETLFGGGCTDDEICGLLGALREKGESVEEIRGFAKGLMRHCRRVPLSGDAVDLCGTGGSGLERFNVSTTAAFVIAASGLGVAKHGNRGSKKPNGSFDLLEKLGIAFDTGPEEEARLFADFGLCFMFARTHHPAMKSVGPARAKLGARSIFNLAGPLCNPAGTPFQIVGALDAATAEKIARVFQGLGKKRVMVLFGHPGIDEFSISGPTLAWTVEGGKISSGRHTPEEFGLKPREYASLPAGDAAANASLFHRILSGDPCDGLLDMVALNAGAALFVAGRSKSVAEGLRLAKETVVSGRAREFFMRYPRKTAPA